MARGDRFKHGQPHEFGQDCSTGPETKEEDLHRSRSQRGTGKPFLKVPQALRARNHQFSWQSAVGKRGCACVVLQQKTEREKNDTAGGPSPNHGGRILTSGDTPSPSHATEFCPVTVIINNVPVWKETTMDFVYPLCLFRPIPRHQRQKVWEEFADSERTAYGTPVILNNVSWKCINYRASFARIYQISTSVYENRIVCVTLEKFANFTADQRELRATKRAMSPWTKEKGQRIY